MTACSRLSEPHSGLSDRRSVLRWLLVVLSVVVIQQSTQWASGQVLVTGSVRDSVTLLPLVSAHVILDGTVQGTITNRDGAFEITLPDLPATLVFRHIGYNSSAGNTGAGRSSGHKRESRTGGYHPCLKYW